MKVESKSLGDFNLILGKYEVREMFSVFTTASHAFIATSNPFFIKGGPLNNFRLSCLVLVISRYFTL